MRCSEILVKLEALAPISMACEWDNSGFLAGRADKEVKTVFLALDATDQVVEDAILAGADLLLTHHPLIFKSVQSVTDQDFIGRRLLKLIQNDVACAAMHTNFDAAPGCMADLAADRLGLVNQRPLEVMGTYRPEGGAGELEFGIGRAGDLSEAMSLEDLALFVKKVFDLPFVNVYGSLTDGCPGSALCEAPHKLRRAAVCPGSGGSAYAQAIRLGAEVYITGDVSHHQGIDAVAQHMAVIDAGHYGIEHIFMDFMEQFLNKQLDDTVTIKKAALAFPSRMI